MYFAHPWGLLALLALPAIVAIHLYHRRLPPLLVAGLHLWGAETEVRTAGRRRDRLPITASLLLELLAALILALLLGQPRFDKLDSAPHLVVVLDNSASMSAVDARGRSLRDDAVEQLADRVQKMGRNAVVTLILTGRRPIMLAGPATTWTLARGKLAEWQPHDPEHDSQPAWDLAAQLSGPEGKVLFLSDHVPSKETVPAQMEVVSVGKRLENVAITAARWTFDSAANRGSVFLRVSNLGGKEADAVIRGRTPEQSVFSRSLTLPGKSSVPLETELPGGLGTLTVEVSAPDDALAVDSSVTLIEPKVRMLTVALALPADHPGAAAVRRVLEAMPDLQLSDAASAHLIIGPADAHPPHGDAWWLGIGPLQRSAESRENARDLIGPFLLEKQNPLLEGVVLGGVIWGGVQPVDAPATPVIAAGKTPLLARLEHTATTAYLLNADLSRPNLADSPDWPILMKNLLDLRRDALPGLRRWNYRLNEDIVFRLFEGSDDRGSSELTLIHNGKPRPLARSSVVEVPPLGETGVYEVRDGDAAVGRFAVNFFDPEESALDRLQPGTLDASAEARAVVFAVDSRYSWLIMLGIALVTASVVLDWKVLGGARRQAAGGGRQAGIDNGLRTTDH